MKSPRAALAVVVVVWASSFPMIRLALDGYGPFELAFLRYLIAALALLVYARASRLPLPRLPDAIRIAGLGLVGMAAYGVLLGYGQKTIPAGAASLLISSSPVWMVVFAALFSGERPGTAAIGSMLLSFGGAALIATAHGDVGFNVDGLAVVAAAMAGAAYSVFLRPYTARYGALAVTLVAMSGSALALLPLNGHIIDTLRAAPPSSTAAVVYLGVLPGVVGYGAWAYATARASAAAAGVALYLVPVVAMGLSYLLLGEVPSALSLLGGALVLGGVFAVHARRPKLEPVVVRGAAATVVRAVSR